jgi:SH3-like domain-containing protein
LKRPSMLMRGLALGLGLALAGGAALAQEAGLGPVTKLPMPRFVSLKADSVNLREGPNRDHPVKWIFKRAGLPVEITAEFEQWRRIRDSDGTEGWVLQNLLSGRRTALVAPWSKEVSLPLFERADGGSSIVARLEPKVLDKLWGVYPNETVE